MSAGAILIEGSRSGRGISLRCLQLINRLDKSVIVSLGMELSIFLTIVISCYQVFVIGSGVKSHPDL